MSNLKNIIFDISNVIIDVKPDLTHQVFALLCRKTYNSPDEIINYQAITPYEMGDWSDGMFREKLRKQLCNADVSDTELDDAWNRMLLPVPDERLDFCFEQY